MVADMNTFITYHSRHNKPNLCFPRSLKAVKTIHPTSCSDVNMQLTLTLDMNVSEIGVTRGYTLRNS